MSWYWHFLITLWTLFTSLDLLYIGRILKTHNSLLKRIDVTTTKRD